MLFDGFIAVGWLWDGLCCCVMVVGWFVLLCGGCVVSCNSVIFMVV